MNQKIARAQYAILFKVADKSKRGLVSWDDFAVFQTILKRPDADYWIAFQYFDVYARINAIYNPTSLIVTIMFRDESGTITFDEFKNVFSSNLGPDSIPFDFNWCVRNYFVSCMALLKRLAVTGSSCISEREMELMFWAVSRVICVKKYALKDSCTDNEFTQLMKGLQGERLRQAFKHLDSDQDGFIRPDQFKRIIMVCSPIPFYL